MMPVQQRVNFCELRGSLARSNSNFAVYLEPIEVTVTLQLNAQVQVWLAPLPIHSFVGAIANRGQWEQGCSLFTATDLGPVRATRTKKNFAVNLEPNLLLALFQIRHF